MNKEDVDFLISIQDLEQPDFDNACLERENTRLQQELQRKDNIINELKEWLNQEKEATIFDYNFAIEDVLDKIKELETGRK